MKKETLTRSDVKFTLVPNKSITLFVKGNQKSYLSDDPLFDQIIKCIKEGSWDVLNKLMNPEVLIEKLSKGTFKVIDGVVYVGTDSGTHELPEELNSTVLEFMNENLPYNYLVKFAAKLFANQSESSVKQLYKYLVKNQFPICEDGDFIAYRKVTNNFKDFRTETFDNSIGSMVEMKREDVDPDPNVTCSRGLHAANWDYVHNSYYPGQGRIVAMKINPADVVSVPTDYNDAKMRVCKFYVLEEVKVEYTGPRAYKFEHGAEDDVEEDPNMDCICRQCNDACDLGNACEVLHCDTACNACFDENGNCYQNYTEDLDEENCDVPVQARPHTVSLFEDLLMGECDQDTLDELSDILNGCLAFSTESRTVFVLSVNNYDWFVDNIINTGSVINETVFYEALRAIRGKKACPSPVVLELRTASRNGTLKVFNKKKFDKEYRDILGVE